jgi:hypothetical protein
LAGLPFFCFCSGAYARGGGGFAMGGGFHGGGGFNGGSFRGGGGWAAGPRGGFVITGHQEGAYARPFRGGELYQGPYEVGPARRPYGGEAVRGPKVVTGPQGGEVVTGARGNMERGYPRGPHMVTTPGNWGPYYGPTYTTTPPGVRAQVPVGTVGTIYNTLPPATVTRTVRGTRYYYNAGIYYLPCYQGSELAYCVVPDPNQ